MRRNVWVVVGVVVCLALAAALILPAFQPARVHTPAMKCMSNLKQIALACLLYSGDHNEVFPPSLGALVPEYVTDCEQFLCPVAGKAEEFLLSNLPEGATDASAVWSDRFTDYVYVEGLRASDAPDCVIAYHREGNHEDGRCAVCIGGHVRWMKEPEFRAALAKTEAWIREHPRPDTAKGTADGRR